MKLTLSLKVSALAAIFIITPLQLNAYQIEGLIDGRFSYSDSEWGWTNQGLDKQRFDSSHDELKLGQAVLHMNSQLFDTIIANVTINGYDDRNGFADLTEAYLLWKPLPTSSWRWKTRVGAFFPKISFEHEETGWIGKHTLSTSSLNAWIGEEIRAIGFETTLQRPGRFVQSPHDFEFSLGAFGWNDPAGSLLAWRGWSSHDRVTSLFEELPLANLEVYSENGPISAQGQFVKPFMEIDDRFGFYAAGEYRYKKNIKVRVLHYDNNGDPKQVENEQYSWDTAFSSVGLQHNLTKDIELTAQYMLGSSDMGTIYYGAFIDFSSWYVRATYKTNKFIFNLRYEQFDIKDKDHLYSDNNNEDGKGIAFSVFYPFNDDIGILGEYLFIQSNRPARYYWNHSNAEQKENSLQLAIRYHF